MQTCAHSSWCGRESAIEIESVIESVIEIGHRDHDRCARMRKRRVAASTVVQSSQRMKQGRHPSNDPPSRIEIDCATAKESESEIEIDRVCLHLSPLVLRRVEATQTQSVIVIEIESGRTMNDGPPLWMQAQMTSSWLACQTRLRGHHPCSDLRCCCS